VSLSPAYPAVYRFQNVSFSFLDHGPYSLS
jgi:hypothetical protein